MQVVEDHHQRARSSASGQEVGDGTEQSEPLGLGVRGIGWLRTVVCSQRGDQPGETSFEWRPVVVTEDVSVVEGITRYPRETFRNLWVIRLDGDGRCREFTEWWMAEPRRGGR